ncbi:MAG: FAD-binding protein, partial [Actinobacteria bacterium]|nr:FAD-binding protein [Actinomycetota bacterium]
GVLLAAGGFARDGAFRRLHQPAGDEWSSAGRGDTGDLVKLGIGLGADTALMDDAWWGPAFVSPEGARQFSVWERSMPGAIIVDQSGERFVNESASYVDVGHAILERDRLTPAIPSWLIMDARHRRRYAFGAFPPGRTPKAAIGSGFVVKAGSIAALAAATGIDGDGLRRTIDRFNGFARTGVDEDFRRGSNVYDTYYGDPRVRPNPNLGPIGNAPFWAVKVFPGDLGTKGGLVTDVDGRVLRPDGSAIGGLYAAGNTTATVMGRTYPGPGGTLGPALVFAYRAARAMAETG